MSTSDHGPERARPTTARRALEAALLAGACAILAAVLREHPGQEGMPHPGWIAVALLGMRHGRSGFFSGVAAVAAAAGIGAALTGGAIAQAIVTLGAGANLVALAACLGLSWAASTHLRREADLRERLCASHDRATEAESTAAALEERVAILRARAERASSSLSFLRDAATRLEGDDPAIAVEGAADLALVRSGASAISIDSLERGARRRLVLRQMGDVQRDPDRDPTGPNLLVPIRAGGVRVGVMRLWGLPSAPMDRATAHDLAAIASWCAPAVAEARRTVAAILDAPHGAEESTPEAS